MRLWIFVSLWACLASPILSAAQRPANVTDIDRIIAIVNDDVITESELIARLGETKKQLTAEKIQLPPDAVLKKQLLERMILERIQLQVAAQTGIRVSDSDVERAIQVIATRNKLSIEALYQALGKQGMEPTSYRNQIRDQIAIQQLLEREINSRITVSESEVNGFLETEEGRGALQLEYNLSHIFIALPESASSEIIQATKQRTENIQGQLRAGGDFQQAAVTHSQGADALKGGHLNWKKAGQLPELFVAAVKQMRPGDVSNVLRGPNGFHILKLHDVRGESKAERVLQTHVRHILLRPSEIQSVEEARNTLTQLRARIKNGEDFSGLARAHSEDTTSAARGGDLGWVEPNQLVPEFEQAMSGLQPNDVSEPVRTPFGLHLIQVLERRQQDAGQERLRGSARNQIHTRKANDRFEQWVRQLRDEAYVEYLLEDIN